MDACVAFYASFHDEARLLASACIAGALSRSLCFAVPRSETVVALNESYDPFHWLS